MSLDLVTGASGLLGGNLVRCLVASGRSVRILARPTSKTGHLDDLELETAIGDITDPDSLSAACAGVEHVYHCAALVSMWPRRAAAMQRVNVTGTEHVVAAARAAGVRRLIHCSSVDGIGLPEGEAPSDEGVDWNWDRLGHETAYARTKYESQRFVQEAAAGDLDAVVVNPTYMLGPYDARPSSGQMILEVAAGKAVGYTRGGNNFVHVVDVAQAMIAAAERGRRGELYILGGVNLSYREVMTLIAEVVGARPPWFSIPYPLARIGGWCGDFAAFLSGNEPTINTTTVKMGYVNHYYSPHRAIAELGMAQTPIRQAIEDAVAWFRQAGMLATR